MNRCQDAFSEEPNILNHAIKFIRNIGFETIEIALMVILSLQIQGFTVIREAVNKVAQFEETNLPYLAKLGALTQALERAINQK